MTDSTPPPAGPSHGTLAAEIADAVALVPGVAFLRPGFGGLLRSTLPHTRSSGNGTPAAASGVRLSRPGADGILRVEVHLVARGHVRTADVARAAGRAAEERLAVLLPGRPAPRVTVTVTGLV